jgi:hypothetical protein
LQKKTAKVLIHKKHFGFIPSATLWQLLLVKDSRKIPVTKGYPTANNILQQK